LTTLRVDPFAPDPAIIARAAELLRRGEVVAFPTETVYGLGADATNPEAVQRIYDVKGRPAYNPLIVHVPDATAARRLAAAWPGEAEALAERWWPGPLTLVVRKSPVIPDIVTAGLPTVALRVPAHPVAQAILRASGVPMAAPSANLSGMTSPSQARHVERCLGSRIPLIIDGGPTEFGIESTVVDLSGSRPRLLRPGSISRAELERLLGPLEDPSRTGAPGAALPSPGMLDRHYAPAAELWLYPGPQDLTMHARLRAAHAAGAMVGAVVHHTIPPACDTVVALPPEPLGYARGLYQALHRLDERGCRLIVVEPPPETPAWAAIRDRLTRASG
jgi:L-threonylcarbamoyladenylate synthase